MTLPTEPTSEHAGLADLGMDPEPDAFAVPVGAPAGTPLRELATDPDDSPADSVKLPGHLVHIWLEQSGTDALDHFTVRVDNRDYVRWDKYAASQKLNGQSSPFIFQTYVGWSAANRAGRTQLTFAQFQAMAVEVEDDKGPEARPTQ